jgi:hypothetical protein
MTDNENQKLNSRTRVFGAGKYAIDFKDQVGFRETDSTSPIRGESDVEQNGRPLWAVDTQVKRSLIFNRNRERDINSIPCIGYLGIGLVLTCTCVYKLLF